MRDLQVFSPSHVSKCPYTKPKKWVLLWGIAYFKAMFSNLIEVPSVLPAESAEQKCILLLLIASSSFANDWLPTLTSSMWQICKTSDGEQVLLRPPLSLQHLVTGGQTEGPGSWSSVQRPGSRKKEWWPQTLLSQNYSIPEHQFNSHFSKLWLCCFWPPKPGVLVLVLFKE